MELKARECPHCHRQVSLQVCSKYLLRGTNYTVRCNHCNTELALVKEPIPFNYCVMAGFLSGVIPAQYCLYILKMGLIQSMTYAIMLGLIAEIVCIMLTFKKIKFKRYI